MENGHFYTRFGDPAYDAGIAEARKQGLYPSVTTILRIINKEGINRYRVRQMMEAALTLPRRRDEDDASFIQRIEEDAAAHSQNAALQGTLIHEAIDRFWNAKIPLSSTLPEEMQSVAVELEERLHGIAQEGWTETSFANHRLGYGGRIDFFGFDNGTPVVIDYKTQAVKEVLKNDTPKFVTYPEWAIQLAAYRYAMAQLPGFEIFRTAVCKTVLISTNPEIPGVKIKEWPEAHPRYMDLQRGFKSFVAARSLYFVRNNLKLSLPALGTSIPDEGVRISA